MYYHFILVGGFRMIKGIYWDPVHKLGDGFSGSNGNTYTSYSEADFFNNNYGAQWPITTQILFPVKETLLPLLFLRKPIDFFRDFHPMHVRQ